MKWVKPMISLLLVVLLVVLLMWWVIINHLQRATDERFEKKCADMNGFIIKFDDHRNVCIDPNKNMGV